MIAARQSPVSTARDAVLQHVTKHGALYLMVLPAAALVFIFNYIPMYGIVIAFQDYQPIHGFSGSPFAGLQWFRAMFSMPDSGQIFYNTLFIALLKIIFGQLAPITFALLLNEIAVKSYKRTIQTLTYLPHFLSWVMIGGIFIDLLSTKGIINHFLNTMGVESIFFLGSNKWFRFTLVVTDVWKGFGWGTILYLAALSGIDPNLYEAAVVDGANRVRRMWHITLPGIVPTVVLLATLSLRGILDAGFEQVFMLYNPAVYRTGDIIDTFVYRIGLIDAQYSLATAVGLLKSVIGLFLIALSYRLAARFANYRIF